MVIEAIGIAFLSFWLANEYVYNVYFRIYVDSVFFAHLTTYTVALGLGIGLAGSIVAAALYKSLRETRTKLEAVAPKIRGSVEKMLTSVPSIEPKPTMLQTSLPPAKEKPATTTAPVSITTPKANEEKN